MPTILFSGGGSSGHLAPSIAVADAVKKKDKNIRTLFVTADRSDETSLLKAANFEYRVIHAGKFPRGLSLRLVTFPVLAAASFVESLLLLFREKPSVVFSKGGFVSVPVAAAARLLGIPVVLHSSDSVPNLSDRFIGRFARVVCTGFPFDNFPGVLRRKAQYTGNPVRPLIAQASRDAGKRITGFSGNRPVVMVIGGSQGSLALNKQVAKSFEELLTMADVIHITGQGKSTGKNHARYFARPYVTDELPHLYALADVVVTRAGAGVLSELSSLSKAAVVVPLSGVAHDHQMRNAEAIAAADACVALSEERLAELPSVVALLLASPERRTDIGKNLSGFFPRDAAAKVATITLDALAALSVQS